MCPVRFSRLRKPETVMRRWLIWLPIGFALCACQTSGGTALDDCPTFDPCAAAGQPPFAAPMQALAAATPLWPGCPVTLEVMAPLHPIVFRAVRPEYEPDAASDPSDWICPPPDDPLQRAGRQRPEQAVAAH